MHTMLVWLLIAALPKGMVRDPNNLCEPGDEARLISAFDPWPVTVARDRAACEDYAKALRASNAAAINELKRTGRIFAVKDQTPVVVVKFHDLNYDSFEVRFKNGPHKGKVVFAFAPDVPKLIKRQVLEARNRRRDEINRGIRSPLDPDPEEVERQEAQKARAERQRKFVEDYRAEVAKIDKEIAKVPEKKRLAARQRLLDEALRKVCKAHDLTVEEGKDILDPSLN